MKFKVGDRIKLAGLLSLYTGSPYGTVVGYNDRAIYPYMVLWDDFEEAVDHHLRGCILLMEPNDILKGML